MPTSAPGRIARPGSPADRHHRPVAFWAVTSRAQIRRQRRCLCTSLQIALIPADPYVTANWERTISRAIPTLAITTLAITIHSPGLFHGRRATGHCSVVP